MTIIQPNKNTFFSNTLLAVFCAPLLFGIVWLVVLYNQTVNIDHGLESAKTEIQKLQAVNAELQDALFGFFDDTKVDLFAKENNLIKEKNPQYIEMKGQWEFASQ